MVMAVNATRKEVIDGIVNLVSAGNVVKDGKLPPERELAALLGTTRPALREGLIALEALGILEIRDRQGIFLVRAPFDDACRNFASAQMWPLDVLSQVMEIRQVLDPPAAALAALRHSPRDLSRLEECLGVLETLRRDRDPNEASLGAYWNRILHGTIFSATGNSLLSRMYESLLEMTETGIAAMRIDILDSAEPERSERILEQHRRLVEAIRSRNPRAAGQASREHLQYTVKTLIGLSRVSPLSDLFTGRLETSLQGI